MKKIVIFVDSLARGGAERVSVNLANYLFNKGILCTILTERIKENEYEIPNGVRRISLNVHGNKYLHYVSNVIKMRKILKNENADILLAMDLSSCLFAIPSSRGLNIKVVVSERNDPAHFSGKKIIAYVSRLLMTHADGFVFQTNEAKQFYHKLKKNNGVVIPNPIYKNSLPLTYNGIRKKEIVNVGRLCEQKNQKLLIKAFSNISEKFPDYKLIIYGKGNLESSLKEFSKECCVEDKVLFPGNKKDVLERINSSELFVLSSDYEGMPNALLEAMAMGIPCISTDCPCGGPNYVIENGVNGVLVPVGNCEKITEAIEKMLTDKEYANQIGNNSRKIIDVLDSEIICKKWMDYLESI